MADSDLMFNSARPGFPGGIEPTRESSPDGHYVSAWGEQSIAAKELEKSRIKGDSELLSNPLGASHDEHDDNQPEQTNVAFLDNFSQPIDFKARKGLANKFSSTRAWTADMPHLENQGQPSDFSYNALHTSYDDNEYFNKANLAMNYNADGSDHNLNEFLFNSQQFSQGGGGGRFEESYLIGGAENSNFASNIEVGSNPETFQRNSQFDILGLEHNFDAQTSHPHPLFASGTGEYDPMFKHKSHTVSTLPRVDENPLRVGKPSFDEEEILTERLRQLRLKQRINVGPDFDSNLNPVPGQPRFSPNANMNFNTMGMAQNQEYDPWESAYLNNYMANLNTFALPTQQMPPIRPNPLINQPGNQSLAAAVLSKRIRNNNNFSAAPSGNLTKSNALTGPMGANLFVFNFPRHFTDQDLCREFTPFGRVLSATVFIDKATGRSKCFGFVSYDSIDAAHMAIQTLNGCQMGGKVIKVQLKRESGPGSMEGLGLNMKMFNGNQGQNLGFFGREGWDGSASGASSGHLNWN